jgi:hypothetical protein
MSVPRVAALALMFTQAHAQLGSSDVQAVSVNISAVPTVAPSLAQAPGTFELHDGVDDAAVDPSHAANGTE